MDTCILELGARDFHLFHGRVDRQGILDRLRCIREPVALAASVEATGGIGRRAWTDALRALERLSPYARRWTETGYLAAVVPDGFGGANNAAAFAAAARRRVGISTLLLSADEACRLLFLGVQNQMRDRHEPVTILGLGDLALDVAFGRGAVCEWTERLELGVVRLNRAFDASDQGFPAADAPALFALMRLCLGPAVRRLRARGESELVVSGDAGRALLEIGRVWGFTDPESSTLCRLSLHALVPEILGTPRSSLCRLGIDPRMASRVATAAVMLDSIADQLGQRAVRFSTWGVREGAALASLLPEAERRLAASG